MFCVKVQCISSSSQPTYMVFILKGTILSYLGWYFCLTVLNRIFEDVTQIALYIKLNSIHIWIGCYGWSVGGKLHKWSPSSLFHFFICIKQVDSMLFGVFWVIDHRKGQNVIRTSTTHSPNGLCALFLFLPHFDVICQLFVIEQICLIINLTKKYRLSHKN